MGPAAIAGVVGGGSSIIGGIVGSAAARRARRRARRRAKRAKRKLQQQIMKIIFTTQSNSIATITLENLNLNNIP